MTEPRSLATQSSGCLMDKRAWLVLAALIALAFNLRSPLTAIPPVIGAVRASLGLIPRATPI